MGGGWGLGSGRGLWLEKVGFYSSLSWFGGMAGLDGVRGGKEDKLLELFW